MDRKHAFDLPTVGRDRGTDTRQVAVTGPEQRERPRPVATVVIPSHNRVDGLRAMLRDLASQQTGPGVEFEVVVVNSDEGADVAPVVDAARDSGVAARLIHTGNNIAAKRNAGADAAMGDLLVFADDDMRLPPGWVQAHVDAHARWNRSMACGAVEFPAEWIARSNYYRYKNSRQLNASRPALNGVVEPQRVVTMNGSIPRDLYLEVGGSRVEFEMYGGEDVELGFRLARAGVALRYAPDALAEHHEVISDVVAFTKKIRTATLSSARVMSLAPEAVDAATFRWTEPGAQRSALDRLVHVVLSLLARKPLVDGLARLLKATDSCRFVYSPLAYKVLTLLVSQLAVKDRASMPSPLHP